MVVAKALECRMDRSIVGEVDLDQRDIGGGAGSVEPDDMIAIGQRIGERAADIACGSRDQDDRLHRLHRASSIFALRTSASLKAISSEEHTSELQSLMRISYAVFCLKNKNKNR